MKRLLILLSLGFLLSFCANAQAPISGDVNVMPLDAPILEEIQENSSYKAVLTDNNFAGGRTFYGKLRITISGEKVRIATRKEFLPTTLVPFDYNIPIYLSPFDLEEYFHPEALDFQGLNFDEYMKSGLPEGSYSLCIEVYDVRRDDRPVSNRSCTTFYVKGNYPPLIISPKGEIPQYEPQNIQFTWAPLHSGSFPVNYTVQVWEKQTGLTDDQIVEETLPFYQMETPNTSFIYGAEHPLVESNTDYLVRVKIDDVTGRNKFINEGYSRIETFGYDPCGEGKDFIDSDGDGVCDALDFCPGFNDNIDLDNDGLSDYCDTSQDPLCVNKFDLEFGQLVAKRLPEGLESQQITSITIHDHATLNGTYVGAVLNGYWRSESRNFQSDIFQSIISINLDDGRNIAEPCHYNTNGWQITEVTPVATPSTDCTETSFTANWEPVQDAFFYKLYVTTAPNFQSANRVSGYFGLAIQAPTTSFLVENIDPSLTYYYRVRAHYLNGSKNETDISQMSNRIKVENCLNCEAGEVCNDDDDCTENDVYDENCNCAGELIDENDNGICDTEDEDDGSGTGTDNSFNPPIATAPNVNSNSIFIANWTLVGLADGYYLDVATVEDFAEGSILTDYSNLQVTDLSTSIDGVDLENNNYYYRVKAYNDTGETEYSNVVEVTANSLAPPIAYEAEEVTPTSFLANWQWTANAANYLLDISTNLGFTTFVEGFESIPITGYEYKLEGLEFSSGPYYYRLRAENEGGTSDYSNVIEVELPNPCIATQPEFVEYECGTDIDAPLFDNMTPIVLLKPDDIILAGDWLVKITEVIGTGPYYGKGKVYFPELDEFELYEGAGSFVNINVNLNGIGVNTDCRMIGGYVDVTGAGIDVLGEDALTALNDFIATLETIEQWLNAAELILQQIDDFLEEFGQYLPPDVLYEVETALSDFEYAVAITNTASTPEAEEFAQYLMQNAIQGIGGSLVTLLSEVPEFLADLVDIIPIALQQMFDAASNTDISGFNSSKEELDDICDCVIATPDPSIVFLYGDSKSVGEEDSEYSELKSAAESYYTYESKAIEVEAILGFAAYYLESPDRAEELGQTLKTLGLDVLQTIAILRAQQQENETIASVIANDMTEFINSKSDYVQTFLTNLLNEADNE